MDQAVRQAGMPRSGEPEQGLCPAIPRRRARCWQLSLPILNMTTDLSSLSSEQHNQRISCACLLVRQRSPAQQSR